MEKKIVCKIIKNLIGVEQIVSRFYILPCSQIHSTSPSLQ